MHFHGTERSALLIDGNNLYFTAKALRFEIDYKRLLAVFRSSTQLVAARYYTTVVEDQTYSSMRPLLDFLEYNGFQIVTRPAREFTDAAGQRRIKGSIDIELAIDALTLAKHLDHVVLVTGNGDFTYLVAALQELGTRVSVLSTLQSSPVLVADGLRRQADQFIDLIDLQPQIERSQPAPARAQMARRTGLVQAHATSDQDPDGE